MEQVWKNAILLAISHGTCDEYFDEIEDAVSIRRRHIRRMHDIDLTDSALSDMEDALDKLLLHSQHLDPRDRDRQGVQLHGKLRRAEDDPDATKAQRKRTRKIMDRLVIELFHIPAENVKADRKKNKKC